MMMISQRLGIIFGRWLAMKEMRSLVRDTGMVGLLSGNSTMGERRMSLRTSDRLIAFNPNHRSIALVDLERKFTHGARQEYPHQVRRSLSTVILSLDDLVENARQLIKSKEY